VGENGADPSDFDAWLELARTDPDAFEVRRLEAIERYLASLPEDRQEILRRFQWRIDRERERAKTPLGACIRLSEMLSEQVHGEGGLRDRLGALAAAAKGIAPPSADGTPSTPPSDANVSVTPPGAGQLRLVPPAAPSGPEADDEDES
jgi:hypothetical protein